MANPAAILMILVSCLFIVAFGCSKILARPSTIRNTPAKKARMSMIIGSK